MAFLARLSGKAFTKGRTRPNLGKDDDLALNYRDEVKNINRRLRQLKGHDLLALLKASSAALLLGSTVALLATRRFRLGILFMAGFVLQATLSGRRKDEKEVELERYALKAERGDYGKLEVIPFR